ncbi:MAG TPA: endonuclease NucS [bacterium]|nr:endonuclease NucS [bacterium]
MIQNRNYYRIMAAKGGMYAEECYKEGYIGMAWLKELDMTGKFPDDWREFNKQYIPVYLEKRPDKTKIAAGLACGMLHTLCKGMQIGDIVLCPNAKGAYYVGEVTSDYQYQPERSLPHTRAVQWYPKSIDKEEMSQTLKSSTGSPGTVHNISKHAEEIERLIAGNAPPPLIAGDTDVEDAAVFALEMHLEDFLVANWSSTELGKDYDIYEEDGEPFGQQYPCDTGAIDILATRKDKKEILVVELKKGRASDVVVGQIQRYMGYVMDELAEPNQSVRGVIIAMEDDLRLRRALRVTNYIDFYRYQVSFKLIKG